MAGALGQGCPASKIQRLMISGGADVITEEIKCIVNVKHLHPPETIPPCSPPSMETISSTKNPASVAKKVEGHCSKGSMILRVRPSGFQVEGRDIRLVSSGHMPGPKLIPSQGTRIWLWGLSYWRWTLASPMGGVPARREGPSTC